MQFDLWTMSVKRPLCANTLRVPSLARSMIVAAIGRASSKPTSSTAARLGVPFNLSARRSFETLAERVAAACISPLWKGGVNSGYLFPADALLNAGLFYDSCETIASREADWRHSARCSSRRAPWRKVGLGPHPAGLATECPAEAIGEGQSRRVRQSAGAITLQGHPLPPAEFRKLRQRENEHLAVFTDHRDRIGILRHRSHHRDPSARPDIHHLLALAGLGNDRLAAGNEALAVRRRQEQSHLGLGDQQPNDIDLRVEIDEQPDRFAEPARARQLVAGQGV